MPSNIEEALLSSPDPLNDSPTFSLPVKVHSNGIRKSLPLQGSSPRKQTFQLDVGDQLSPQKIRVTVEAELPAHETRHKGSRRKNSLSPTRHQQPVFRQNVRTTTTTIPVKGLSDSEDDAFGSPAETPKRGRGRPRKSTGTPIPSKVHTRTTTPGAKSGVRRRRTLGDMVDGDDSEDWDFVIGAGVEVGRGKGRSRSRSLKGGVRNKATPAAKQNGSPDKTVSSIASKKGRGRRKTLTPEEFQIREDESGIVQNVTLDGSKENGDANSALAPRHINQVPWESAFSTIRSTTTVGDDDPDILLAKFSPAKKTPAKTGWSSPTIIQVLPTKTTNPRLLQEQSPLPNTAQSPKPKFGEGSVSKVSNASKLEEERVHEEEAEDQLEEMQDFDTILESEGFSMISVESVPSLREHLSSPITSNQEEKSNTPLVVEGNIKRTLSSVPEDSFSSIAPEIMKAVTPGKKPSDGNLSAVRSADATGVNDSFSSIPPEILEAATPGKRIANNELLSVKTDNPTDHEDSFSSVPPAILEAATPAKRHRNQFNYSKPQTQTEADPKLVDFVPVVSMVPSTNTRNQVRNSSGLLSPDDTPSPTDGPSQLETCSDQNQNQIQNHTKSEPSKDILQPMDGSSILLAHIKSSPPSVVPRRFTYTAHLRQQRSLHPHITETPSIVFSSPSLPPLAQPSPPRRHLELTSGASQQPPRQSLSPIVRAGRMLQDIATTSPLRSQTQSLGSPFKSPSVQRNSMEVKNKTSGPVDSRESRQKSRGQIKGPDSDVFGGFSDDTRRELHKSLILGEELSRSQTSKGDMTSAVRQEDPFNNRTQQLQSPPPEDARDYTLEVPNQKPLFPSRFGIQPQEQMDTIYSDSAMSWQPENAIPVHNSSFDSHQTVASENTKLLEQRREAEWARERAAVSSQIESASTSQVIVISSDNEEEDIWQAEARHSSSILDGQAEAVASRQEPVEKPRRSKLPSPWRKNSKRLTYSDELAQMSSPPPEETPEVVSSYEATKSKPEPTKETSRKRLPVQDVVEEEELPESSIMWHIPQKQNFAPRPRSSGNLDLSALLASSPVKAPTWLSHENAESSSPPFTTSAGNSSESRSIQNHVSPSGTTTTLPLYPLLSSFLAKTSPRIQSPEFDYLDESTGISCKSEEDSEEAKESSATNVYIRCPSIPPPTSPSPRKSCLRTPTSMSPAKSVAFVSPTPAPQPLSGTTWSKAHWKLLDAIYKDYKTIPTSPSNTSVDDSQDSHGSLRGHGVKDTGASKLIGLRMDARGYETIVTKWHMDIVGEFREEVSGWAEDVIAKRLFSIIVGEQMRKEGKA